MLFFIDESWQTSADQKRRAGVLAAISIKSHDFNKCSQDIFNLKVQHLGRNAAKKELKGQSVFKPLFFRLEAMGVRSKQLELVRDVLSYMRTLDSEVFASIVFKKEEIDLACADTDLLERPFVRLFERINLFMNENHPELIAKLVFDDRGVKTNQRISAAVSNFFHRSRTGHSFNKILKVPLFAISTENVGIQVSDIVAYTIGKYATVGQNIREFHRLVKDMEFKSRERILGEDGKSYYWYGFKYIKEKRLATATPVGAEQSMRRPDSPPPTSTTSLPSS